MRRETRYSDEFDAIAAVETLYRTDLSRSAWTAAVMAAVQPLIDPDRRGVHGGFYRCPDPFTFEGDDIRFHELNDPLIALFNEGMRALNAEFIAATFLCSGVASGTRSPGFAELGPARDGSFRAHGLADVVNVLSVEPDGGGFGFGTFRSEPVTFTRNERALVAGIQRHMCAAHRLHRRLNTKPLSVEMADAVLDANGRVLHAGGHATSASAREALRASVNRCEEARGRRRREDPVGALHAWEALALGRWSLVEHFELDGRRYLLAVENTPQPPGFELLSLREREVVERALRGQENKVIAYELGVAHSTVKVLMARAATKLGVRSRAELLARFKWRVVAR